MRQAKRLLLVSAAALATVPALAQEMVQRDGVWAQTYVGRAADSAVRLGQLPNGMRYAIQRNNTPPGQMAVRLRIGSGSMAEPDGSEGIAHFVEHMAFRGSNHVADGELARILQRRGLAFGADTNASTTQEATVYQFDFPKSDVASLNSALMLMRETASELTFPTASVDAERGVVLSEERERDSPAYQAQKALLDFALAGQLAPRRWPIGNIDVIAHSTAAQLRAFYRANYRPDNATLVIVGDIDPAAVEVQIKASFGDWTGAGRKPTIDTGRVDARGEQVRLFSKPGAPQIVEVSWARSFDRTADTEIREYRDVVRGLATAIINRRFQELSQQRSPPFIGAGFNRTNTLRSVDLTALVAITAPDKWQQGLTALNTVQRRIVRDGVSQAELDQAKAQLTAYLTNASANETTRPSPKIANDIVKAVNENALVTSPEQDLAGYQRDIKTITVADVRVALREAFSGAGPLIFVSSTQPIAGGESALRSAFDTANEASVEAVGPTSMATWPYTSFGPPGAVTDRHEIADLGVTVVHFANGNTLTVKPTTFTKDEVLVNVEFGHGRVGLPRGLERSYWMVNGVVPTFLQGGTGKLSLTDITNLLSSHVVQLNLATNDTSFYLSGKTRLQDLDAEMQLATAYLTDPGFRPEAALRMQAGMAGALPQIEANPAAILQRDEDRLHHDGDPRWTTLPSAADLAASKPDDVKALLQPSLSEGQAHVTIVGDITVDRAIKAVAATIGARQALTGIQVTSGAMLVHFPSAREPIVISHSGRADQAIVTAAWPTTGFWGHEADSRAMTVAMAVIQTRLFDRLRAADGATYSPSAESDFSSDLPDYGKAEIRLAMPPEKIAAFEASVRAIIADLASAPVSSDELDRAKQPRIEQRLRDRQTNVYWVGALAHSASEPRDLVLIRERVEALQAVTAIDVQRVCVSYLTKKSLEISIRRQ